MDVAPASIATSYVASVESESMTTISSSSAAVSISAERTRDTTSPTVAASLRAGTTRLIRVPPLRSSSSSSDQSVQWCVWVRSHPVSLTRHTLVLPA